MCSYSFTGYMRVILRCAQDDGVHISFAMKGCHIGDSCPHIEKLPYLL